MKKTVTASIRGWVARAVDDVLYLYAEKPHRIYNSWYGPIIIELDSSLFPGISYCSEPQLVEITIKKIEE